MTIDAGIYCECDDFEMHPNEYKKVTASSMNPLAVLGLLLFIYIAALTLREREH